MRNANPQGSRETGSARKARATLGLLVALLVCAVVASPASAGVHTYTMRSGGVKVGGYRVVNNNENVAHPRVNGFITKMSARIVDDAGRPIPVSSVMLHHLVFHNFGKRPGQYRSTCNEHAEPFFGAGEEKQVMDLPPGYGYRIRKDDRWKVTYMLMNHRPDTGKGHVEYTMTIDDSSKLAPVKPFWLRTIGCKQDPIFNIPGGGAPGSTYTSSKGWTVPFTGRLIAGGGHLHGGAKDFTLTQPRCGNRALVDSKPLYGQPDNIVYHVLPVLHEPGPINTSWTRTSAGIPVVKGERLALTSDYDGELPHTRVMAIMHIYVVPDPKAAKDCPPYPADLQNLRSGEDGRTEPPLMQVPITRIGSDGLAHSIEAPPGRLEFSAAPNVTVNVRRFAYDKPNLSVKAGATIKWKFGDSVQHDVTLANGPRGFASQHYRSGGSFRQRLTVPGDYRLFCSLHPIQMQEKITVTP